MNIYLPVVLFFLGGVFLLDTLADLLNLSRLGGELPKEFQGIYDPKKYEQSLHYQKAGVYFEGIRRTFFLIITLFFILSGGFNQIDLFARHWGWSTVPTGLIFVALLLGFRLLLALPFSIYDTFVLEAKFGFNKTTPTTFLLDLVKSTLIGLVLGSLIFSAIVYFFENAGPYGWVYSWVAFTGLQLLLTYLAPALILPLFNQFSPLPQGELRQAIEEYAKTRNFQLNGIFTMDSSKRSTKSNAFFTGFGRFRRLVLFDTLLTQHTQQETVAILAHEIGHFEKKHIIRSMLISMVSTGMIFYIFSLFLNNQELFEAFKMEHTSTYASVVFTGFLYDPLLRIFSIFSQSLSRKHEYEADQFSVETYGQPETLISALKKLSVDSLSHLTPHPLKVALEYSHPPILERIYALRQLNK